MLNGLKMHKKRRIRVMYVDGNLDGTVGGSYFSLYYLATGLNRERFEPMVVFSTDNTLIPDFRAAAIDTRIVPMPRALSVKWNLPRFLARPVNAIQENLLMPIDIRRLLKREHVDILHLNNSTTGNHEWMLAAFLSRIPCVTHERGINRAFSLRTRFLARRLAAVVCISDAVRRNFDTRNFAGLRLITILNGLDPQQLQVSRSREEVRRSLGVDAGIPMIGMIGNIRLWKGQEILIRAVTTLRDRWPNLQCLLLGSVSPCSQSYVDKLETLVSELGLKKCIMTMGYRRDVADYLNALDIVVHASTEPEPFGRVLLEAMALSKPLVASRAGAIPEIVEEGVTGLTFQPGDSEDLARCIAQLLRDPVAATMMGDNGRRRLIDRFCVRKNVEMTEALYERVLA